MVTVLGLLSGTVVLALRGNTERAQDAACATDRATVERAIATWTVGHGAPGTPTMQDLVDTGQLRQSSEMHRIETSGRVVPIGVCVDDPQRPAPATTWTATQGTSNVRGHADGSVSLSGSSTVFNDQPLGVDGTVALTADLTPDAELGRHGSWGIWIRAEVVGGSVRSGYTFQWDLNFGRNGSFVLRHWDTVPNSARTGMFFRECSQPTAVAPLDAAALGPGPWRVAVSVDGARLTATVDGVEVMRVADLDTAVAAATNCPDHRPPQGTHTGLRSWGTPPTIGTFSDASYS